MYKYVWMKAEKSQPYLFGLELKIEIHGVQLINLGGGTYEDDDVAQSKRRFGITNYPLRCMKKI